jgi:hypothetical protein
MSLQIVKSFILNSVAFTEQSTINGAGGDIVDENLPAALACTLSTRTDADTGVLTFTTDPGLTVGQRVDVYWAGGCRRGMKVSSISGSGPYLVTIGTGSGDVGAGDNLPVVTTVMSVGKPVSVEFLFTGNNAVALVASAAAAAVIVLTDASDVELTKFVFLAAGADQWNNTMSSPNPVAGDAVAKVYLSHGDISGIKNVKIGRLTT